ncbi:MAG: phosphatase PAP2 family protein [Prevotella sp.]|nr:phosphatase PAP2 family protein [Prevotella sp.]
MIMTSLFKLEKKPKKGLLAAEWAAMIYLVITLLLMLFTYTKLSNPESMLWGRIRIVVITAAMWGVYRMIPCRFTRFCRILAQMALLSWWYPDTYEFNRMFPNLDHVFASWEQSLFGCQPALLFSQAFSSPVFSELMDLGYASYYPLIAAVTVFYFFCRYKDFGRASFIILGSFFIYYIIYIAVPVAGPQYYYPAAGLDNIAAGVFPDVGNYFATLRDALASPGYKDGIFYQMVVDAHNAGERPTAAFPSSHVGVSTILLILAVTARNRRLLFSVIPLYVLLCLSTVYIYAHYAIDVFGGWISAVAIYAMLHIFYVKVIGKE